MHKLTKTVLNRPIAAIVCVVALIIFGFTSVTGMSLQLIPDMNMPMMIVYTVYPQAGPEDVERLVTEKIEDACATVSGLDTTQSQSLDNMSTVIFQFDYGTNMDSTYTDMQEAVDRVKADLPDGVQAPVIMELDMNASDSMTISIDTDTDTDLLNEVNKNIEPELKKVSDVADITVSGGEEKYISIQLYPEYVAQYGLDISSIATAITSVNFTMPAGSADYGNQSLNLSSEVRYEDIPQLEQVPITTSSGQVIHLSDVANVHYATKEADSLSRYNGNNNVSIGISKKQSSSAVTLSNKVQKTITSLEEEYPDLNIKVVYDASETIISSLESIAQTLLLAILLSMAVLFLFFGDMKASLIVGSSMPVSVLLTFIMMHFLGFSLNMVTMGALVIGIGMMVDNAIVVIEMCFRKHDEGLDFKQAAYEGTKVVTNSIIASTITSVVVYLPMAGMEGISGQMFGQLGYTIVFALLASLVSAVTLIPLCFSVYKPKEKKGSPVSKFLVKVSESYGKLLSKVLHKKKIVSLFALILFVLSVFLAQFVRTELMASTDEGQVSVAISYRPGLKLENMDAIAKKVEQFVAESPEIENYSTSISQSGASMMGSGAQGTISAYVKSESKFSTAEIVDQWNQELVGFDNNCTINVTSASSMGMSAMSGGTTKEIVVKGTDLDDLKIASKQVEESMKGISGVLNIEADMSDTSSKAEVVIDPIRARSKGFTAQQVANLMYINMTGTDAMDVTIDNRDYTVTVEYPTDRYENMNDVSGMTFTNTNGVAVPLTEIADIVYTDTPQTISREDGQFQTSIKATLTAAEQYTAGDEIQKRAEALIFPETAELGTNSMDEMMAEEFGALGMAIVTAIFLIFMVMAIQFESIRYSLLVMFCIPFSLIGSIALLLISRGKISMTSLMGFLMLVGIVVNNGILFVDTTNLNRKTMRTEDALIDAGKSRLRPILMTTLTTILSMIPMALGWGDNAAIMQGMSLVIIGGLTASTILTLILLPTFYMIIHNKSKEKKLRKQLIAEGKIVEEKRFHFPKRIEKNKKSKKNETE
ncbi:MAG: efflux RND transporter permease subunit [Lachnospiraceae bacterium]|nr:efflux RND transporter permease subunit [Lachnospiraceae bacterium]